VAPRPVDRFVDELRPVAVGRLGVEPVGEQEGGSGDAGIHDRRLDQVRLDRLARAARRDPDVPNEDAVAILGPKDLEGWRPSTGSVGHSVAHPASLPGQL
jgi:hypothetical protein